MKALITFISILLTTCTFAMDEWKINPDHSEVSFRIAYLGLGEVSGKFKKFKGSILESEQNGEFQKAQIFIGVESIDTGNKKRDKHLIGSDFFRADSFPFASFKSSSIKKSDKNNYLVEGFIQIKDIEKKIQVNMNLSNAFKDSWGKISRFAKLSFDIRRGDFGINWNKTLDGNSFLLGDEVKISLILQLQPAKTMTSSFKHLIPDTKYTRLVNKLKAKEINLSEFKEQVKFDLNEPGIIPEVENKKKKFEKKPLEKRIVVKEYDRSFRDSFAWWLSYMAMAIIGLIAFMIVLFQGKYMFMEFFPEKFDEVNGFGLTTDLILYPILSIYVLALWYLGFA